jgi:two-component system sensor histidine kinase MprB
VSGKSARRRISVRTRVAVVSAAAMVVAMAASSASVFVVVRHDLVARVDATLRHRARVLGRRQASDGLVRALTGPQATPVGLSGKPFAEVFTARGRVISTQAPGTRVTLTPQARRVAAGADPSYFMSANLGVGPARILITRLASGLGLAIVAPDAVLVGELNQLTIVLAFTAAFGVVVALGLGAAVAGVALRPVRRLTLAAEQLATTRDLGSEIEVAGDDELSRLGRSINSLLRALDRSQQAQRQLVADASHELRTPLTSLRTNVEVLVEANGLTASERRELVEDIASELGALGRLIDNLIDLARDEGGTPASASMSPLALDELVADVVDQQARLHRRVQFQTDLMPLAVRGIAQDLERAVANLLDNAAKWSPDGQTVSVRLRLGSLTESTAADHQHPNEPSSQRGTGTHGSGSLAILTVCDVGPGIPSTDLPHVFERFYRGTSARTVNGSGLGLAIVQRVAQLHGGTVRLGPGPGGGTEATLAVPAIAALPGPALLSADGFHSALRGPGPY